MPLKQAIQPDASILNLVSGVAQFPDRAAHFALLFVLESVKSQNLPPETIALLRNAIPEPIPEPITQPQVLRRIGFLSKFGIEVLGESKVRLALPAAVSPLEFLKEAQELFKESHFSDLFELDLLKSWKSYDRFKASEVKERRIAVEGIIPGSHQLNFSQQKVEGWNNVCVEELAVAYAAHFIATGRDFLNQMSVRGAGFACSSSVKGFRLIEDHGIITDEARLSACRSLELA